MLRDLLSPDGSIYLHIDYKIGHYVKLMMDEVFGRDNFRNDIARIKCNPKNFSRAAYGNIKDMVLFYSRGPEPVWNEVREPLSLKDVASRFSRVDRNGRRYTTIPLHAPGHTISGPTGQPWRGLYPPAGRHWRVDPEQLESLDRAGQIEWSRNGVPRKRLYADESSGKKIQDIWTFKDPTRPQYPTEKNLDLLDRIIKTSSNEGDLVLDAFAGSGTTMVAAVKLGRRCIAIDESPAAISVIKKRLDSCSAPYTATTVSASRSSNRKLKGQEMLVGAA
jgi:adenine-specific DNA-methyltransferase